MNFHIGQRVKVYNPQRSKYHRKEGRIEEIDKPNFSTGIPIRNIRVRFGQEVGSFDDVELEPISKTICEEVVSQKQIYYLQLTHDNIAWEEVDEYTFNNYEQALGPDGKKPRYTGNMVLIEGDKITIRGENLTGRDICVIMRFCGIKSDLAPQSYPAGLVRCQEFIRFRKGRREWIHETNGDNHYKRSNRSLTSEEIAEANKLSKELKI